MHQNLTQPQHARRTFAIPIDFAYGSIPPKNHSISSCSDFLSAIPAVPHSEAHFPRRPRYRRLNTCSKISPFFINAIAFLREIWRL
jgi:hypothetical protein